MSFATRFCSLLIGEGMSVVEVAAQAGHAPTMTLDTYAHVMADMQQGGRLSAEDAIRVARDGEVSGKCPSETAAVPRRAENPDVLGEPTSGFEPGTPSLRVRIGPRMRVAHRPRKATIRWEIGRAQYPRAAGVGRSRQARYTPSIVVGARSPAGVVREHTAWLLNGSEPVVFG
jgi:hypothetical protein